MESVALSVYFASLARIALGQESASASSAAAPTLLETGSGSMVETHVVTVGKVRLLRHSSDD